MLEEVRKNSPKLALEDRHVKKNSSRRSIQSINKYLGYSEPDNSNRMDIIFSASFVAIGLAILDFTGSYQWARLIIVLPTSTHLLTIVFR